MTRTNLLIVFFLLCYTIASGQSRMLPPEFRNSITGNDPYKEAWVRVNKLLLDGLPKSAEKVVDSIYEDARHNNRRLYAIKAQLYLLQIHHETSEKSDSVSIAESESFAAMSPFPYNAIWKNIEAQMYWNYYAENRYEILERSKLNKPGPDFEFWDAATFFDKISSLYMESLRDTALLKSINITDFNLILYKGKNTATLRTNLFDLLAFRALEYFTDDEKDIVKPAEQFVINDDAYFGDASAFVRLNINATDHSPQWFSLQLYQQILRLHKDDAGKSALIDADLQRLEYVYRYTTLANKEEHYIAALWRIVKKYPDDSCSSMALYKIADLLYGGHESYDTYNAEDRVKDDKRDLRRVIAILDSVITRYPSSQGSVCASQLKNSISSKQLTIRCEEVILPDEYAKLFVFYKNLPHAWLRIYPVYFGDEHYNEYGYPTEDKAWLYRTPVQAFELDLPGTEDFKSHSTEIKLDPLPPGKYMVTVADQEAFSIGEVTQVNAHTSFTASSLSMVRKTTAYDTVIGYVLNRKTGLPVPDAKVAYRQMDKKLISLTSGANGAIDNYIPQDYYFNPVAFFITKGRDTLKQSYSTPYYSRSSTMKDSQVHSVFFTDRAIYRPGQTLYFKGMYVCSKLDKRVNYVLPYRKAVVLLKDVNGSLVDSLELTANEFGSYSGKFTIPENVLTGTMYISNRYSPDNSHSFSVEEYKRPKFSAAFEELKSDYSLNDLVTVKGKATAYSGSNISGAKVKYFVQRKASYPYLWCYDYYQPRQTEDKQITQGIVKTDENGDFKIAFNLTPDSSIDARSLPVFTYEVSADITDLNGESHSAHSSVQAGYVSTRIEADIPESPQLNELDSIIIKTKNLSGEFVQKQLHLKIYPLTAPDKPLRDRLWPAPDKFTMTREVFKKYFPNDIYGDEDKMAQWPKEQAVYDATITTVPDGMVGLPTGIWKRNGWYVAEMETTDRNGQVVTEKKYFQLWDKTLKGAAKSHFLFIKDSVGKNAVYMHLQSDYTDSLFVLRQTLDMQERILLSCEYMANGRMEDHKFIGSLDHGGFVIKYLAIKENRLYSHDVSLDVPWDNKELDISWETHRDKLLPGQKETWAMNIKGHKKDKVAAEMVAALYDASLDALKQNEWHSGSFFTNINDNINWDHSRFSQLSEGRGYSWHDYNTVGYDKVYDRIIFVSNYFRYFDERPDTQVIEDPITGSEPVHYIKHDYNADAMFMKPGVKLQEAVVMKNAVAGESPAYSWSVAKEPEVVVRKNLAETAFFYPQLHTDTAGNIRIEFTMPEALTEWKLKAFAHTRDMATGYLEGKVKTQKDLMVVPGLPRFLRQNDRLILSAKISNLADHELAGVAHLEILDAGTLKPVNTQFKVTQPDESFTAKAGNSTAANWDIQVPDGLYGPVVIRITARAGSFTDGEENTLPVVSNRMLVTETMPVYVNGDDKKVYHFDKLEHSDTSKTLQQHALTVEYTGNPAWYALQALPYLMEFPYECAEQTFNRYYANALGAHIMSQNPKLEAVFTKWEKDSSALLSNLDKNSELKSALLAETPWVLQAKSQTEQRHQVGLLFSTHRLSGALKANLKKLEEMHISGKGFAWFKGMESDRYISQYILTGMERLKHMGVSIKSREMNRIEEQSIPWLDGEVKNDYNWLIKHNVDTGSYQTDYSEVGYLYLRSFKGSGPEDSNRVAFEFYKNHAAKYWTKYNAYMQGMIAISLWRLGDKPTARAIVASLRENAHHSDEMGMYWMQRGDGFYWYQAPIEAQSLLIECFSEITGDVASVDAMKLWLLKQKQTQSWPTTTATADACYALLLSGTKWLEHEPQVNIQLGDQVINSDQLKKEAGTGYFKVRYDAQQVQPQMGNIHISVTGNDRGTSWGGVYWQYFEDMDKITSAATPLVLKKELLKETSSSKGPVLEKITKKNPLHVGDKVRVRIELTADRNMEYVHLKDMRAACFEPVDVISSFQYRFGLGFYQSTKDVATNFFFNYLSKGKYVFEYTVFVTTSGDFSNGISTIQCMYAPEFSSHSEGISVHVE